MTQAPGQEIAVTGSLEGWDAVLLLLGAGTIIVVLLWPLLRAVARRIEAGATLADARLELDEMRDRIQRLETAQPSMAELEERLDFAERLLAQVEPERQKRLMGEP
jgi:hypothetical protein